MDRHLEAAESLVVFVPGTALHGCVNVLSSRMKTIVFYLLNQLSFAWTPRCLPRGCLNIAPPKLGIPLHQPPSRHHRLWMFPPPSQVVPFSSLYPTYSLPNCRWTSPPDGRESRWVADSQHMHWRRHEPRQ